MLSRHELLFARDVGESEVLILDAPSRDSAFIQQLTPLRCLLFGFRSLFKTRGGMMVMKRTAPLLLRRQKVLRLWELQVLRGQMS
jgi:hypothetical protein